MRFGRPKRHSTTIVMTSHRDRSNEDQLSHDASLKAAQVIFKKHNQETDIPVSRQKTIVKPRQTTPSSPPKASRANKKPAVSPRNVQRPHTASSSNTSQETATAAQAAAALAHLNLTNLEREWDLPLSSKDDSGLLAPPFAMQNHPSVSRNNSTCSSINSRSSADSRGKTTYQNGSKSSLDEIIATIAANSNFNDNTSPTHNSNSSTKFASVENNNLSGLSNNSCSRISLVDSVRDGLGTNFSLGNNSSTVQLSSAGDGKPSSSSKGPLPHVVVTQSNQGSNTSAFKNSRHNSSVASFVSDLSLPVAKSPTHGSNFNSNTVIPKSTSSQSLTSDRISTSNIAASNNSTPSIQRTPSSQSIKSSRTLAGRIPPPKEYMEDTLPNNKLSPVASAESSTSSSLSKGFASKESSYDDFFHDERLYGINTHDEEPFISEADDDEDVEGHMGNYNMEEGDEVDLDDDDEDDDYDDDDDDENTNNNNSNNINNYGFQHSSHTYLPNSQDTSEYDILDPNQDDQSFIIEDNRNGSSVSIDTTNVGYNTFNKIPLQVKYQGTLPDLIPNHQRGHHVHSGKFRRLKSIISGNKWKNTTNEPRTNVVAGDDFAVVKTAHQTRLKTTMRKASNEGNEAEQSSSDSENENDNEISLQTEDGKPGNKFQKEKITKKRDRISKIRKKAGQHHLHRAHNSHNRSGSFNEDKPWKNHVDIGFVTQKERKRYEGMWVSNRNCYLELLPWWNETDAKIPEDGLMLNLVVSDIWSRSNLPQDTLANIYDKVDTRKDACLDRKSFIVGMWLVDQCLYGRKLPNKLDQRIWDSVDRYVISVHSAINNPKMIQKTRKKIMKREIKSLKKDTKNFQSQPQPQQ